MFSFPEGTNERCSDVVKRWIVRSARDDRNAGEAGIKNIVRRSARSTSSRAGFRAADEDLDRSPNLLRDAGLRRNKLRRKPREQTDQIVRDQNLAVAMVARANADRGNLQRARDLAGRFRTHDFGHDCECARFLHCQAIAHERFGFGLRAAFDFVAAFFTHTLRQHSDVAYERNPFRYDRLDLRDVTDAALELDGL